MRYKSSSRLLSKSARDFCSTRALRTLQSVCLEVMAVPKRNDLELSEIEEKVIGEIRYWRSLAPDDARRKSLGDPVTFVHLLIETRFANVQLHIRHIIPELGVSLRTLERGFRKKYEKNVKQHIIDVRLESACSMLGYFPKKRIGDIAERLGYTEIRDFNRFFSDHTHMSPTEWRERDQATTERNLRDLDDKDERDEPRE